MKGVQWDFVTPWVDRNLVPYYKGTWASLRRVASSERFKASISLKDRRFA